MKEHKETKPPLLDCFPEKKTASTAAYDKNVRKLCSVISPYFIVFLLLGSTTDMLGSLLNIFETSHDI